MVNKKLNFEAKTLLKAAGRTRATLGSLDSCKELWNFAKAVGKTQVVPFAGFSINIHPNHSQNCRMMLQEFQLGLLASKVPA